MNRRTALTKIRTGILALVGIAVATCKKIAHAAESYFYWPGIPSTEALREHLATSPKHNFGWDRVRGKSRAQLISMHDSHHFKRGDSAPRSKTSSSSSSSSSKKTSSRAKKSAPKKSKTAWITRRR